MAIPTKILWFQVIQVNRKMVRCRMPWSQKGRKEGREKNMTGQMTIWWEQSITKKHDRTNDNLVRTKHHEKTWQAKWQFGENKVSRKNMTGQMTIWWERSITKKHDRPNDNLVRTKYHEKTWQAKWQFGENKVSRKIKRV